ncbi:MAG: aminodeoxychorismate synthase component I [Candidatus Omnitrophota bacterium]
MKNFLPCSKPVPVLEKIRSVFSPEEVFSFFSSRDKAVFLNSSMESDAARYSFIGLDPFFSLESKGSLINIALHGQKLRMFGNPLKVLKSAASSYNVRNKTQFPLISGGMGYFSYEVKNLIEDLAPLREDDIDIPEIWFNFYRCILIFDKRCPGEFYASVLDLDPGGGMKAGQIIDEIKDTLSRRSGNYSGGLADPEEKLENPGKSGAGIISNFTKEEYVKAVEKTLGHIKDGDIYQACLSQRFSTIWETSGYGLYLKLNKVNPSPFGAYINGGDFSIISSSPELFLRRRDNVIETRPMKGTRPAGSSCDEDAGIKAELEQSAKDKAELLMIVDLERNDLGKIAVPGSVRIEEPRRIERHPTVFQAISIIKGNVEEGTDNLDILEAAFPGGSITGCPKIRAMNIISDIEPCIRGVYTGSIGYLSFHGTMDMNIAIRTMTLKEGNLYFHAGGGIVSDSDPEEEYEETLVKARALMDACGANPD